MGPTSGRVRDSVLSGNGSLGTFFCGESDLFVTTRGFAEPVHSRVKKVER